MGKRKTRANFSGLSRFVGELKESQAPVDVEQSTPNPPSTVAGVTRKASELQEDQPTESRSKKRKVGLLGPGYEKYDATGLAPHYTHISQVPDNLKKCELNSSIIASNF